MTTDRPVQSAAPDELAVRVARVGLPARGAQDRQGAPSSPLQAVHRAVLGAFLSEARALELTAVGRLAAERQLEPQQLPAGAPNRGGRAVRPGRAVEAARRSFGGLLHPGSGHDPAASPTRLEATGPAGGQHRLPVGSRPLEMREG
jgi:hypothetical protein